MKNFLTLFLFSLIIFSIGCDEDDAPKLAGNLEVQFEPEFDDQAFFTGENYTFPNGRLVRFSKLDFYISGVEARVENNGAGEAVELTEVAFMDLTGSMINPADPDEAIVNSINLPAGDYSSMSFVLGLNPELNAKMPSDSDLGTDNPLKKESHYWADWNSYIFMKVEGNADFNDDGIISGDETFIYHTGKSGYEQTISLAADFSIVEEEVTVEKIGVNVNSFFFDGNGQERFDMNEFRSVHADITVIDKVMKGAAEGISMKN